MFNSGRRGKRTGDGAGIISVGDHFNQQEFLIPTITGYSVTGDSDYEADDLAVNAAGGQTITVNGSGFKSGAQVRLDNSVIGSVSVTPTAISFTAPAKTAGTYTLYVTNPNGGTAVLTPGVLYSGTPTWSSPAAGAELGPYYETTSYLDSFVATNPQDAGSSIVYSLYDGTFPSGATLDSNAGTLSGTAPVDGGSTTYSFTIKATDSDLQDTLRSFTLTVNTDVVTWSAPDTSQTISLDQAMTPLTLSASSAAGYSISYSADSLPTGLTLANDSISGTPTVEGSQYTTLTATAATTNRTATRTITWTIQLAFDAKAYADVLIVQGDNVPFNADASSNDFEISLQNNAQSVGWNPFLGKTYGLEMTDGYVQTADLGASSAPGTGNFCLQLWYKPYGLTTNAACINYAGYGGNGFLLRVASGNFTLYMNTTSVFNIGGVFTIGKWHHVALARNGTDLSAWVNGTRVGNTTNSTDLTPSSGNRVFTYSASWHATNERGFGTFSNVRWDVGDPIFDTTATSITVPTEPLTTTAYTKYLSDQSPYAIDNSSTGVDVRANISGTPMVVGTGLFDIPTASVNYGSLYCPTSSDYLYYSPAGSDSFGTGNFTVECWFNPLSTTAVNISMASSSANTWQLLTYNNNLYWQENGSNLGGTGYGTVELNAWSHLAVSRSGTTLKLFINGVEVHSTTNSYNYSGAPTTRYIGPQANGTASCYISNFRIVKGTAVYTTDFTPPTSPLTAIANTELLTCQTNGNIVNNKNNLVGPISSVTYTAGSIPRIVSKTPYSPYGFSTYFDGSGDYINITTTDTVGTNDFTFEGWLYLEKTSSNRVLDFGSGAALLYTDGNGKLVYYASNGARITSTNAITINTWFHFALVRISGTSKLYIDGTQTGSDYSDSINYTSTAVRIGADGVPVQYLKGYVSNLRIIFGTGLYTGSFTPSTTPLTPTDETSVLVCHKPYFVDGGYSSSTLTSYGTPSNVNYSPFAAHSVTPDTYGIDFDGNQDYVTYTRSSADAWSPGTGDFTLEAWFFLRSSADNPSIIDFRPPSTNGAYPKIYLATNRTVIWYLVNNSNQIVGTTTINLNTWYHVAVVRDSGTTRMYLNGTQVGSNYTDSTNYSNLTEINLGIDSYSDTYQDFDGIISNVRFVHSVVYTDSSGTITVPTSPLTAVANTVFLGANARTLTSTAASGVNSSEVSAVSFNTAQPVEFNPFGFTSTTTNIAYDPNIHGGSFLSDNDYIKHTTDGYGLMPGRDDFTIQLWWYYSGFSAPGDSRLMDINRVGQTTRLLIYYTGSALTFYSNGGARISYTWNPSAGKGWHHIAVSRVNGTTRMFLNGIEVGTSFSDTNNYMDYDTDFGFFVDGTVQRGVGWIADATVHHTGLYSGNFIPPKRLVYLDYNNKLAASAAFNTAGIFDKTTTGLIELGGNTKLSSFSKYGDGSVYFADYSDYALLETSDTIWDLKGDFTVEAWIYPTNDPSYTWGVIDARASANAQPWIFGLRKVSGSLVVSFFANSTAYNGSTAVSLNTWTHIAASRVGSDFSLYVNGSRDYNATNTTDFSPTAISQPKFGSDKNAGNGTYETNGYIDGFRITNGEGRYSGATITVPTRIE